MSNKRRERSSSESSRDDEITEEVKKKLAKFTRPIRDILETSLERIERNLQLQLIQLETVHDIFRYAKDRALPSHHYYVDLSILPDLQEHVIYSYRHYVKKGLFHVIKPEHPIRLGGLLGFDCSGKYDPISQRMIPGYISPEAAILIRLLHDLPLITCEEEKNIIPSVFSEEELLRCNRHVHCFFGYNSTNGWRGVYSEHRFWIAMNAYLSKEESIENISMREWYEEFILEDFQACVYPATIQHILQLANTPEHYRHGWSDLVLWHPSGWLLLIECKSQIDIVSEKQRDIIRLANRYQLPLIAQVLRIQ